MSIKTRASIAILALAAGLICYLYFFFPPNKIWQMGLGGRALLCIPKNGLRSSAAGLSAVSLHMNRRGNYYPDFGFYFQLRDINNVVFSRSEHINQLVDSRPSDYVFALINFTDKNQISINNGSKNPESVAIIRRKAPCLDAETQRLGSSNFYLGKCHSRDWLYILFDSSAVSDGSAQADNKSVLALCNKKPYVNSDNISGETIACDRIFRYKNLLIEYTFNLTGPDIVPTIDQYIDNKIDTWGKNCKNSKAASFF